MISTLERPRWLTEERETCKELLDMFPRDSRLSFYRELRGFLKHPDGQGLGQLAGYFGYPADEAVNYINELLFHDTDVQIIECERCHACVLDDEISSVGDSTWCDSCTRRHAKTCDHCDETFPSDWLASVHGWGWACESCCDRRNFVQCGACAEWWRTDDEDIDWYEHIEEYRCAGCAPEVVASRCEPKHPDFDFRVNCMPEGKLHSDDIIDFEMPSGVIGPEGLRAIAKLLWDARYNDGFCVVSTYDHVRSGVVDPHWQTKAGNFTKRLAKFALQHEEKIPPALLSKIGNVAREHADTIPSYRVAFTRRFDQGAAAFVNEDSCWWGSEWHSQCRFKAAGGLAIRTFDDDGEAINRAWIQPLEILESQGRHFLTPSDDSMGEAFVLFNGYGPDAGYPLARLVAQMNGLSYRKVEFDGEGIWVNGGSGYLVADVAICDLVDSVRINYDEFVCSC